MMQRQPSTEGLFHFINNIRLEQPDEIQGFMINDPSIISAQVVYYPKRNSQGIIIRDRYVFFSTHSLAKGTFGSVYLVIGILSKESNMPAIYYKTSKHVIKLIVNDIDKLSREYLFTKKTPHLKPKEAFHYASRHNDKKAFMLLRKMPGIELFKFIYSNHANSTPIEDLLWLSIKIIQAIHEQIHLQGLTHFDIKPENVMVDTTVNDTFEVNIIDLGFAHDKTEELKNFMGTGQYIAPEVIQDHKSAGQKADIFSAGVLLSELWGYRCNSRDVLEILQHTVAHPETPASQLDKHLLTSLDSISPDQSLKNSLISILTSALQKDPNKRPTAKAMLTSLHHMHLALITKDDTEENRLHLFQANHSAMQLRECLLATPSCSPEDIADRLSKHVNALGDDNEKIIREFLKTLSINSLLPAKTKQEILATAELIISKLVEFENKLAQLTHLIDLFVRIEGHLEYINRTNHNLMTLEIKLQKARQSGNLDYIDETINNTKVIDLVKASISNCEYLYHEARVFYSPQPISSPTFFSANNQLLQEIERCFAEVNPTPPVNLSLRT
jgi:serine/threonine protein kinase